MIRLRIACGSTPALGSLFEDGAAKRRHVAALDGLTPGITTYYQVVSALVPSKIGRVRTEVDRATPFRLVAFGDTRTLHAQHSLVIQSIVAFEPAFALLTGDLVNDGHEGAAACLLTLVGLVVARRRTRWATHDTGRA